MRAIRNLSKPTAVLTAVLALAACADGKAGFAVESTRTPPTLSPSSSPTSATYASARFVRPFDATVPAWLPTKPSVETANFVTWETTHPDEPAVRFLVPVKVYLPGEAIASPPPKDFLTFLKSQQQEGAHLADVTQTTIAGLPATLMTATAKRPLDGSLGCQAENLSAPDCYGLQPGLILRLAVIDTGDRPLLAWLRHERGVNDAGMAKEFASFQTMLATVHFRPARAVAGASQPPAGASAIDGVWTTSVSEKRLVTSPLLYGQDEINDGNWGSFTFTFKAGHFSLAQKNARESLTDEGTFSVTSDTIDLNRTNGEHFLMRWSIDGDSLRFHRDESIGIGPTPFIISTWTRSR
jgi:hypothetical protein